MIKKIFRLIKVIKVDGGREYYLINPWFVGGNRVSPYAAGETARAELSVDTDGSTQLSWIALDGAQLSVWRSVRWWIDHSCLHGALVIREGVVTPLTRGPGLVSLCCSCWAPLVCVWEGCTPPVWASLPLSLSRTVAGMDAAETPLFYPIYYFAISEFWHSD